MSLRSSPIAALWDPLAALRGPIVAAVVLIGVLGGSPDGVKALAAQEATLRVEENFRTEPNGDILGQVMPGTRVLVVEESGDWSRATIRGFIWLPSVQDRPANNPHNLVVAAPEGENLRDEPSGRVAGRLIAGTVLEELERLPGWVEVRRTGWIWSASLDLAASPAAQPRVSPNPPPASVAPSPAPAPADEAAPPAPSDPSEGWLRGGATGTQLLSSPDGDTVGRVEPGAEMRVVSREGNWARVQLDGWVWLPSLEAETDPEAGGPAVLTGLSAGDLSREYERYRGRVVEMSLQYISLEQAEQVRTDFREGEPFLLTRSLDADRGFVYVAVPPEQLEQIRVLTPLETIRVVARVRAGASAFTGSPILDLIEIERVR
ncbi:MAG: hypothetical protein WD056_01745 [Gemmatimonadota bacterium]